MSKRFKIVAGAAIAVVLLVVVAAAVYLLSRDDAPDAVDLETTVARIEESEATGGTNDASSSAASSDSSTDTDSTATSTDSNTAGGRDADTVSDDAPQETVTAANTATDDSTETSTASSGQTVEFPGHLDGVWTVQTAENAGDLQGEPSVSFAGFRVDEVLAGGIGDFTAVGRTADVTGTIEMSGNVLVVATVAVDMSTLRTDNSSRDGQVRRALNTNEFPVATFTLAEPVELPADMADGATFSGSVLGDLTIKGVTNSAAFDLQARLVGDVLVAVGSSDVTFSDYGVTAPTAPIVVSVEDHGIMEFQLILTR